MKLLEHAEKLNLHEKTNNTTCQCLQYIEKKALCQKLCLRIIVWLEQVADIVKF
jgi:hypothetical protein